MSLILNNRWIHGGLLLLAILISLQAVKFKGHGDMMTNVRKLGEIVASNVVTDYNIPGKHTYPPLHYVVFQVAGLMGKPLGLSDFYAFKFSLFFFLLLSGLAVFLISRNILLTAIIYLAMTLNATAVGYTDIYMLPFIFAAFYYCQRNHLILFSTLFSLSAMFKFPPLIVAPFVALFLFYQCDKNLVKFFTHCVLPPIVIIAVLQFVVGFDMLQPFKLGVSGARPQLSGNAMNFNWLTTVILHLVNPELYGDMKGGIAYYVRPHDPWVMQPPK